MKKTSWTLIILLALFLILGFYLGWLDNGPKNTKIEDTVKIAPTLEDCKETDYFKPLPITCAISEDKNNFIVEISTTGGLTIIQKNRTIFYKDMVFEVDNKNNVLFDPFPSTSIYFEDATHDGYPDLRIENGCGAYQCSYSFYAYKPELNKYDNEEIISGLGNYFIGEDKTITFHTKGRGFGDIFTTEKYQFQQGKYVLIETSTQDILDFNASCPNYIYSKQELKDGKMVTTETKNLTYKDVWEGDCPTSEE